MGSGTACWLTLFRACERDQLLLESLQVLGVSLLSCARSPRCCRFWSPRVQGRVIRNLTVQMCVNLTTVELDAVTWFLALDQSLSDMSINTF